MSDVALTHLIIILAELITLVALGYSIRIRNGALDELRKNLSRDIEREGRRTRGEPDPVDEFPTPPPYNRV